MGIGDMKTYEFTNFSEEDIETMKTMHEAGASNLDIAVALGKKRSTVGNYMRTKLGLYQQEQSRDPLGKEKCEVGTWQFYTRSMMDYLEIRPNHGVYVA